MIKLKLYTSKQGFELKSDIMTFDVNIDYKVHYIPETVTSYYIIF